MAFANVALLVVLSSTAVSPRAGVRLTMDSEAQGQTLISTFRNATSGSAPSSPASTPASLPLPVTCPGTSSGRFDAAASVPVQPSARSTESTHSPAFFEPVPSTASNPGQGQAQTATGVFVNPVAQSNGSTPVAGFQYAVSVPLAFTTSDEGATPSQGAALDRIRRDFNDNIASQKLGPDAPGYGEAWRAAQEVSDSTYEQQFGADAFIAAQLARVHGGLQ